MTSASTPSPAPATAGKAGADVGAIGISIFCFVIWGLVPLFFQAVFAQGVGPWEQTAERFFWALLCAGVLVLVTGSKAEVGQVLRTPKTMAWLCLSALSVSSNWLVFNWASVNGHTLDASLAYFINPLLNMVVGALLFKERISKLGWAAVGLATVGVAVQTVALGKLPLVSLFIAFTFLAYGVIRKRVAASAQTGLFVETLLLTPFGLAFVFWLQAHGLGHFGKGIGPTVMIILLGPATVVPFGLFAYAARRMPLSILGFLQFIAPSLLFVVGVSSGEPLPATSLMSFGLIWAGVLLFTYSLWMRSRAKPA